MDETQFEYAVQEGRCFLTFNRGEFMELHKNYVLAGHEHHGLILSPEIPIGELLRKMLTFLKTHSQEEAISEVFFL